MKMHKLDKDAREWLTACLDPYHDNQIQLQGLPDMVCAPSIVKLYNQTYTLTAPASAVANWDAIIAFTGCSSEIGLLPGMLQMPQAGPVINDQYYATYDHTALATQGNFGTFVVKAGAAGVALDWGAPFTAGDTHTAFGAMELAPASDRGRIIGIAFEVVNTTAEIYKQGSVTVAQLPGAVGDYNNIVLHDSGAGPWYDTVVQSWFGPKFAATHDTLVAVPGSQTWAAKEGLYAIPRMITHTMPVESPSANRRSALIQDSLSDTTYFSSSPYGGTTAAGITYANVHGVGASGFAPIQAYFTGLSHETSLVIRMRTIVEHFPGFGSALLPLTHPSPAFNPKAFEIYSRICKEAPYAVMVKDNSAGEYFRRILAIGARIGNYLAPLAGDYAPVVQIAAAGAKKLASVLEQREKAREKPKTQKKGPRMQVTYVRKDEAGARAMPTRR